MLKQLIARQINRALSPLGYELNQRIESSLGDRAAQAGLRDHLRRLFDETHIDTVIDVGANQGQYYDFLRDKVGFGKNIYSFEPIPELAAALKSRRFQPNWSISECAIGSKDGTASFHVMSKSGWSSLLPKGGADSKVAGGFVESRSIEVQVKRLDTVFPGLSGSIYLKLDTQGNDLEALKGGRELLKRCKAVQTEFEFLSVYEGAPPFTAVYEYLVEAGFALTAMEPLWWEDDGRIGEADAVFRNMR